MSEDIREYVRDSLAAGRPRDEIRAQLRKGRWTDDAINDALGSYLDAPEGGFPCPVRKQASSAREWLQYSLAFVALCACAIAVNVLCWNAVDAVFPKEYDPWSPDQVRGAMATLLVAGSLFAWLSHVGRRELGADPLLRDSVVRRWTSSVLLVATGIAGMVSTVIVLTNIFEGRLVENYTLKLVTTLIIAGSIFLSYYGNVGRVDAEKKANAT